MDVIICKTTEEACGLTAKIIANLVKKNPKAVLGLATGRTMERVYALLAERAKAAGVSFAGCQSFNLDEYWGLPGTDVNSYRYYMNFHLFDHIDIDKANTHVPNGAAKCPVEECANYEKAMKEAGGVDLQLLGIGTILEAKAALLLATGSSKADILAKAVEGPVTSMISSSALQFHQHATIIADEAAAAKLQRQEHYRWVMENDPDMKALIEG